MRMPPFSSFLRTLFTLSSLSRVRIASAQAQHAHNLLRQHQLKSMPTIPFLGSLFGSSSSSSSSKMSFPDQRTDDEWRAVLTKGE